MDPAFADTLATALRTAAQVASALGAPGWVVGGIVLAGVALLGLRYLPRIAGVKLEAPPPPISDGGAAEDRELSPAREGGGPPGGGETGGSG